MENRKEFIQEMIFHFYEYSAQLSQEAIECPDLYIDMQVIDLIIEDLNKVKSLNEEVNITFSFITFSFSENAKDKIKFLKDLLYETFQASELANQYHRYKNDNEIQESAYQYHLIYICLLFYSNDLVFKMNFFEIDDEINLFRKAAEYYHSIDKKGGENG